MREHQFWHLSATEWSAIGSVVAAIAALVNLLVVCLLARYTYRYMKSTADLVDSAKLQAEASLKQADAAAGTLETLLAERRATDSFQEAVVRHSFKQLSDDLNLYANFVGAGVKPYGENKQVRLLPDDWETCTEFVSRRSPERMAEFQMLGRQLLEIGNQIEGIRRTPENWEQIGVRRRQTLSKLESIRMQILNLVPKLLS